ncbi:putative protease S8 tripeptidyl peptidase I [Coniella lustricola]|uniref:Putative protease S8 tripeptidyl peptidase I n=1 Tax=Coniella lustricola TaxID=2025994 RepID=A0A2T3AHW8_9PEZI|nr:putative protease S8 tripeptidyl peptidase I [Coniella lustricola]
MHVGVLTFVHIAATLAGTALGLAVPHTHAVHERRRVPHPRINQRVSADVLLPMRVGLKANAEALRSAEDWLMEVSHPSSPKFGQHWTSAEVIEAFGPSSETIETVAAWLGESGIAKERITHSDNKGWFAFDATVEEAERLLHTEFFHDGIEEDRGSMVGCNEYHLPKHIQDHVDYITPGVRGTLMDLHPSSQWKRAAAEGKRATSPSTPRHGKLMPKGAKLRNVDVVVGGLNLTLDTCDEYVLPECIQALYNFTAPEPNSTVSANNSLGIFEEGDFYAQDDFDTFFTLLTPYIPNGTHPIHDFVDGAKAPVVQALAGGESDLDFELAYPIIYPQTTTLYQTDDLYYAEGGASGIFNTFLDALDGSYCTYSAYNETGDDPTLDPVYPDPRPGGYKGELECGVYEPTNVITISYGVYENDLPYYYQERQCNEFLKLGLQGVSIFVASGDTGVGGYPDGTYGDGPAYGCLRDDDVFAPTQPNSCPWLTNVGATQINSGSSVYDAEVAADQNLSGFNYSSSGGFSNIFGIPSYQTDAIATYFADHDPSYPYYYDGNYLNATNGGLYNRNGRGIPDVAANGLNLAVVVEGDFTLEDGTSASSPIFASLINRIIEERIKVGKGSLGFINPTLYANPQVFHDITAGYNPGCGTLGFEAVSGWDPVTGLGTPDYPQLLELFLGLP